MKFVIDNYASSEETQSLYFNQSLLDLNYECVLFDSKRQGIYDIFDRNQPTHCITHGYKINNELIHYLENENREIDLLINIQNMDHAHISQMSNILKNKNLKSSFFFINGDKEEIPNIPHRNIINICSAADTNLLKQKPPIEYKIDKAIIIHNINELKNYEGSFHAIAFYDLLKDNVDITLPELTIAPYYRFYDKIIIRKYNGYIPQCFFDGIMMGSKVYFDIDNKNSLEKLNNLLKKILKSDYCLDYNDSNKLENFEQLKAFIMDKHTNVNRVNNLLSNIKGKNNG